MPNYIANIVKIKNIKSIPELLNDDGEVVMKFEKIIPMPQSLDAKLVPEDSNKDSAIIYYLTKRCTVAINKLPDDKMLFIIKNITNSFSQNWPKTVFERTVKMTAENNAYMNDKLYELGKRYVDNFNQYGAFTWYDWCIENWGTKWDACDSRQINQDSVYFETAWCMPEPAILALSALHPDVDIKIAWADEDAGNNTGYAIYRNGVCLESINFPSQSENAMKMYECCWNANSEDETLKSIQRMLKGK